MRKIILGFNDPGRPVIANKISPSIFYNKSIEQLKKLEVNIGNRKYSLKHCFTLEEEGELTDLTDTVIIIENSSFNLKALGEKMEGGRIIVNGDAGMHLGAYMSGGEITVNGCVDDWCGAEMSGGLIHILENAESFLGSNYIGQSEGMKEGIIKVDGEAKNFTGMRLAGGEIIVKGDCGCFLGYYMLEGQITVKGSCGVETGSRMRGGVINIHGSADIGLGFIDAGLVQSLVDGSERVFKVFKGDVIEDGRGEIRILQS